MGPSRAPGGSGKAAKVGATKHCYVSPKNNETVSSPGIKTPVLSRTYTLHQPAKKRRASSSQQEKEENHGLGGNADLRRRLGRPAPRRAPPERRDGPLVLFSRLAVSLTSSGHGCGVSVATVLPTVSSAESAHLEALFGACPAVRRLDFHLAQFDASEFPGADPFFLRFEAMRRSAPPRPAPRRRQRVGARDGHRAGLRGHTRRQGTRLPCYVLFTASAAMLSLCVHFPAYLDANAGGPVGDVDVPGVYRIPKASIPQALHHPEHLFTRQFVANGRELAKADGLLVNSFDAFEPEAISALRDGSVALGFPPVFSVGPPARFGSRKAISKDQLRELAIGLEASGHRFLWVVKSTIVDRDDEAELSELLGEGFWSVQGRGMVTKGWVEQEEVLKQESIGSGTSGERRRGERSGLGVWEERWSWEGEEGVVSGDNLAEKVKAVMADETVRKKAVCVQDAAAKAVADGGTSYSSVAQFVQQCWI
ncbi:hypothetical protein ZWY2020_049189 [Hordeum vulgare]|nr:hypothetical protein ZWY2020_049189 [Hordeum vulgare]